MATLTVFANFRIDSDERFLRMVDSFHSFADIDAERWVVNARGQHAQKTIAFLRSQLGEKLIAFSLESKKGWFFDSRQMLDAIRTDFVFFWLEDHINLTDPKKYSQLLSDMKELGSEYLPYSWFGFGKQLEIYKGVISKETELIATFNHTRSTLKHVERNHSTFIISMVGIFSQQLFKKVINKTPLFMRQFSKFCPFDFEKGALETQWLPIAYALPKFELFAAIDDDGGIPGYSLQSRGLYPIRETRPSGNRSPAKSPQKERIKKLIPRVLYKRLIRVVIFYNRFTNYVRLVWSGN